MQKLISWLANFLKQLVGERLENRSIAGAMIKLSNEDKALFAKFCQFVWTQGEPVPLIFDVKDEIYTCQGITLSSLKHLQTLDLLTLEPRGYIKKKFGKHTRLFYAGKPTKIVFPHDGNNQLDLGHVLLTEAGKELAIFYGVSRNQEFYEYVIARWFQQGLVVSSIQLDIEKLPYLH